MKKLVLSNSAKTKIIYSIFIIAGISIVCWILWILCFLGYVFGNGGSQGDFLPFWSKLNFGHPIIMVIEVVAIIYSVYKWNKKF